MTNLSYAQLEGVWLQAAAGTQYATNAWAALMAAIAEAESGGNPNATNPTDNNGTQTSWGLWQISLGNHSEPSPNWNNPLINAQLAIGKLESQGLTAWGTYTSGAYKAFLSSSTTPDTSGNYDTSSTSAVTAAQTNATLTAATTAENNCAWGISYAWGAGGGLLAGFASVLTGGGSISSGQICIVSKSQVRAVAGWTLVAGGIVIMSSGLAIILAAAGIAAGEKIASSIIGVRGSVGVIQRGVAAAGIAAVAA